MKKPVIFAGYDYGVGQGPPAKKPGMFRSARECAIKLALLVLFVVVIGNFVLVAVGKLNPFGR